MSYKVIKREVKAKQDGKELSFNVKRYYATSGCEPQESGPFSDPFIEVWKDGSLTLHHRDENIFLYDDQWLGIIKAVNTALEDKEEERKARLEKWLSETADSKEFHGTAVDLSRNQVIEALNKCQITIEQINHKHVFKYTSPTIVYNGENHDLGRTDLKDDISTGLCVNYNPEQWREHYLEKAKYCMGGRIKSLPDGRKLLSVIDAISDG